MYNPQLASGYDRPGYVPAADRLWTFFWIALTFILFDTLWTLTNVPYYALTSELTDDYDERSSLTTYRMAMAVPAPEPGTAGVELHQTMPPFDRAVFEGLMELLRTTFPE